MTEIPSLSKSPPSTFQGKKANKKNGGQPRRRRLFLFYALAWMIVVTGGIIVPFKILWSSSSSLFFNYDELSSTKLPIRNVISKVTSSQDENFQDEHTAAAEAATNEVDPSQHYYHQDHEKQEIVADGFDTTYHYKVVKNNQKSASLPAIFQQNFSIPYLKSTQPSIGNPNITTLGYWRRHFYSGFRNQIMAFTALCMYAVHHGHTQIVLETLHHKDTYGSNRMIPHEFLFDVEHWNSNYVPPLPRLVRCVNFTDLDCSIGGKWKNSTAELMTTDPYSKGEPFKLFSMYMLYLKQKGKFATPQFRNPVDSAILKGALRPHPNIQKLMSKVIYDATDGGLPYMTLHARIEPGMQKHMVCKQIKVTNLTEILISLQETFPVPPATKLFLPINRPSLEEEVNRTLSKSNNKRNKKRKKNVSNTTNVNWLAIHNLETLNHAIKYGLWNGTVQVFELGSTILKGTKYERIPSTIGAMLNFYLAVDSALFVGTEVSTWSTDVVASRFYRSRGNMPNYKYLPQMKIEEWTSTSTNTSHSMINPPSFFC